jgi:MATE family multidrug resistance protein
MGLVQGMDPLVAQAIGAGDRARARAVLWQAMRIAVFASIPAVLVTLFAGALVHRIGIEPETSHHIWQYLLSRAWSVIPFLIYTAGRTYLQAIGQPGPTVWAFVWTNIANVIGNVLFIYGDDGLERLGLPRVGLPAMGIFGAGLASTLSSMVTLIIIHRAVVRHGGGVLPEDRRNDLPTIRAILRVGWPISMHLLAEVGGFSLTGIFAGWLGPLVAAGHQVALGLASMSFILALGMAQATSVRVGLAVGRNDTPGARRAGFAGMLAGALMISMSMLLFAFAPQLCARVLSDKPEIIAAAVPLIRIAAVFQLADATQAIAAGALRGAGDTRTTQIVNMIGYYVVGLPLAFFLGFTMRLGAIGIWWGLTAALFGVAITLFIRFIRLSKREIRPL